MNPVYPLVSVANTRPCEPRRRLRPQALDFLKSRVRGRTRGPVRFERLISSRVHGENTYLLANEVGASLHGALSSSDGIGSLWVLAGHTHARDRSRAREHRRSCADDARDE
jgi:hypothetical protein